MVVVGETTLASAAARSFSVLISSAFSTGLLVCYYVPLKRSSKFSPISTFFTDSAFCFACDSSSSVFYLFMTKFPSAF